MMKRLFSFFIVVSLLVLMLSSVVQAGDEWSKVKKKYKKTVQNKDLRMGALQAFEAYDTADAVKLMCKVYPSVWLGINSVPMSSPDEPDQVYLRLYVSILSGFSSDEAVAELVKSGLQSKLFPTQALAAEVFSVTKNEIGLEGLHKLITKKKVKDAPLLRGLEAIAAIASRTSAEALVKVAEKEKRWQIQLAIIDAAKAIGDMNCVPAVIPFVKGTGPRVEDYAQKVLLELTGQNFRGSVSNWTKWYEKNKAKIDAKTMKRGNRGKQGAQGAQGSAVISYHGVPLKSDRMIFIIDTSGSMEEPHNLKPREEPKSGDEPVGSGGGGAKKKKKKKKVERVKILGPSRLDAVKAELVNVINAIPEDTMFTVISYSTNFTVWKPEIVVANELNKANAIKFVYSSNAEGATNIYDSLEMAILIAQGLDKPDKNPAAVASGKRELLVDTIFLLSDGSPNEGKIPDPPEILVAIKQINKDLKIKINTFSIGFNSSFMRNLAAQNFGVYKLIE